MTLTNYLILALSAYNALVAEAATVYLAGDSTMARGGGGTGNSNGWGEYLKYSLSIPVVNNAIGGRSARSFTREGRFTAIGNSLKSGDIVIIEFGHNDGGGLSTDNGRSDCPGSGSETCKTTYNGVSETVLTFPAYLQNAARTFKAKGASVIISSQTPNNPYEGGSFSYSPSRFVALAQTAASVASTDYVDHGQWTANFFKSRSAATVNSYFPTDHTHTSPAGANVVAAAFVRGVLCGNNSLKPYVKNGTSSVEGSCGGTTFTTTRTTTISTQIRTTTGTTSASGDGRCSQMYGQCGGVGWTGPSSCCSGQCKFSNDWYSQCL